VIQNSAVQTEPVKYPSNSFVDPAKVLDDLEQQVKLEQARCGLERRFDDYIREQIGMALDGEPLPDVRDTVNRLARDIERELSQVWLPKGETCTTHDPTL
jgi:hypothetical protein